MKTRPMGRIRVGHITPDGAYAVLHEGKLDADAVEDIYYRLKRSTDDELDGMEITLHEACRVDGLEIQSVNCPPEPGEPQLRDFVRQPALSARSRLALDCVVEGS